MHATADGSNAAALPPARLLRRMSWIIGFERFGFGCVNTVLVLFLIAPHDRGGLAWEGAVAILVVGIAGAVIQLAVPLGGYVLDRWPHRTRQVGTLGISLTIAGALGLSLLAGLTLRANVTVPFEKPLLALGILGIALGNGLFKPTAALTVSQRAIDPEIGRDASFTRFWLGIQVGVLVSMVAAGSFATYFNWSLALLIAAAGPAVAIAIWMATGLADPPRHTAPIVAPQSLDKGAAEDDRARLVVILLVCGMYALYAMGLAQVFGLFTVLFETRGDRDVFGFTVPTAWITAVETVIIVAVTPLAARLWARLRRHGREPNGLAKFAAGMAFMAAGFLLLGLGINGSAPLGLGLALAVVLLIGLSEIPLQPVGLSLVSGLASQRLRGRAVGLWYVGSAAGGMLAGGIGAFATAQDPGLILLVLAGLYMLAAALLLCASARYRTLLNETTPAAAANPALPRKVASNSAA